MSTSTVVGQPTCVKFKFVRLGTVFFLLLE
jgi:hypothetical protein